MSKPDNIAPDVTTVMVASGAARAKPKEAQDRGHQKAIITWHAPEVRKQLTIIATENDTTNQKLIAEALNWLFAKYGKAQIA
jgi:hypothetical protein